MLVSPQNTAFLQNFLLFIPSTLLCSMMLVSWWSFFSRYALWCCLLYVLGLTVVSLWPRHAQPAPASQKEQSSHQLPQEGDNFKIVDAPVVYRLERGLRRPYKTAKAFLSRPENPPFGTPYEEGGILFCDSVVLLFYPLGQKMPSPTSASLLAARKSSPYTLQEGTSWLRPDKIGHLLVYFVLALLLWSWLASATSWTPRRVFWAVVLLGSGIGFLLELGQQVFSAGRDAEWADMGMNVLGLLLGAFLSRRWWKSSFSKKNSP